jgi:hypothetical protein
VTRRIDPSVASHLRASAVHAVTIAIGAEQLRVFFAQRSWADAFAERYADQKGSAAGAATSHYVARVGHEYVFWSPEADARIWDRGDLPDSAIVFLTDATAVSSFFDSSPTLISFHAAAVGFAGVAAAITGDSNSGKTTTALACARAGLTLYSDERCVLRERTVVPFARTLSVRSDGWMRLQSGRRNAFTDAPPVARATPEGFSVRISDLFGDLDTNAEPELCAVFVLAGHEDVVRLEPVTSYAVAPALAKWMNSSDRGLQRGARLIETLRGVACFRLFLGAPDESARLIRTTLAEIADRRGSVERQ